MTPHFTGSHVFHVTPIDKRHTGGVVDDLGAFCELCWLPDCCRASGDYTGVIEYPDCLVARIKLNRKAALCPTK